MAESATGGDNSISDEGTVAADQLRTKPADSGVSEVLKYGQVHIQAKLGAFENEEQNCLLAFWDMQCLYKINDKNKILRSAGREVIQKWNEHRNGKQFHKKVILVTPGNNLKYMKIIHVASDITSIYDDAKAGLRKADAEEMKTIVVAIYDKDPFYRDVNKFCTGILRAIKELATELKFVESVTLVIHGKRTFSLFSDIFEPESRQYGTGKKPDIDRTLQKKWFRSPFQNHLSICMTVFLYWKSIHTLHYILLHLIVKNGSGDDTSWEVIDKDEMSLEENKSLTQDDSSKNEKRQNEISVSSPQIQNKTFASEGLMDKRSPYVSQFIKKFSPPLEQFKNTADTVHRPGGKPVETSEGNKGDRHKAAETVSCQTPEGKAVNNNKTESSLLSSGFISHESEKQSGWTREVELPLIHTGNSDSGFIDNLYDNKKGNTSVGQTGQEPVGTSDVEGNLAQITGSTDDFAFGTKDSRNSNQESEQTPLHIVLTGEEEISHLSTTEEHSMKSKDVDAAVITSDRDEKQKPEFGLGSEGHKQGKIEEMRNGKHTEEKHNLQKKDSLAAEMLNGTDEGMEGEVAEACSDPTGADSDPTHVGLEDSKPAGVGTSSTQQKKDPIIGQEHGVDVVRGLEGDTFVETSNLIASAHMISDQEPYHMCEDYEESPELGQSEKLGKKSPLESKRNVDCKSPEKFSKLYDEKKDGISGSQNYGKDGVMEDKKDFLMKTNGADLEQIDNRNLDPTTGVVNISEPKIGENQTDLQEKGKPNLGLLTGVISLPCKQKTSGGILAETFTRNEGHALGEGDYDEQIISVEENNQVGRGKKHGVKNQDPDQIPCMQETKNGIDRASNVMPLEKQSFSSDKGCHGSVSLYDQPVEDIKGTSDEKTRMDDPTTSKGGVKKTDTSFQATSTQLDPTMMGRKRGSQESDKNEPSPDLQEEMAPKPSPRKKQTHSSKSVEEKIKPLDWRCNEGNAQDIKLLINYQKKQGEKNENDVSKHRVSCSLNFHLIWNFYTQTDCGRKMLDTLVAKHDCKVSLPTDQLKEFFIFQVSNVEFEEKSDVKSYVDGVIDSVYISAQESLSIDLIRVDPGIQDDVREKLNGRKQLNSAWIEFINDGTQVTVYTVCDKEHQQSVVQIITELAEDATKSFNSHIEMVTAEFMWQRVMTKFEYLKEIGSKFPNTVIIQDENVNAFQLKGRRDEVKVVAGYLEKLLKTAQNEFHMKVFSSGHQFEIFTYPEMCSYIDGFLPNLPLVWIPNHLTKKIHLFSRDQKYFKGIDKLIEGCVKERFYPLSEGYSKLPSEKIHSLEELKKTYKGQIVIHPSDYPKGLLVTVADEIFKCVDDKVLEIISSETVEVHPETPVPEKHGNGGHPSYNPELGATNPDIKMSCFSSEKVPVSDKIVPKVFEVKDKILFRKLCMEDMAKLNQVAKEHCVSLRQLESQGSRVGFELKGPEKEVQHIYEYLTERIQAEEQQMQLQNDNSGMAAGTEKAQQAASNGTAEMSEDSKVSAKAEEPGLEKRDWSYPNGKKITLVKATSCDANVIIIPGNSDQVSQSHFGNKQLVGLHVPIGTEGKAKTDLLKEIEEVLDKILEKTVGICIKTVKEWNFRRYLKCFLYQIQEYFMRKEGKPRPIECVILFVDDGSDYNNALEIIQKSFQLEQDRSEIVANLKLVLQEPSSIFKRIRVIVQKGQLHEAQTEALVNTVARSLDLTKGKISSSLLSIAGDGIQKELYEYKKGKISIGQVLKTGVGTLPKPRRAIFHGALHSYEDHPDSLKVFKNFLRDCLEHANKKYKSIAFPPIGTGGLGYPKDLVASLMFQSVSEFEKAHTKSKLEVVMFVIYENDQETLKEFEEMYKRCVGASFEKVMKEPQGASPSSSKKALPKDVTEKPEMNENISPAISGTAPSSEKKPVEPTSLQITKADRSGSTDTVPSGKEQHKHGLYYNSEEQCCFFVFDVKEEDARSLEEKIKSFDSAAKFVYPYKEGEAFVICANSEEKNTLMNKEELKKYKTKSVGPQKIQGIIATVDPVIWRKARKMKKEQDLYSTVQQRSGVTISHAKDSIQFKAITSHQLKIAQECLIKFAEETLELKVQKRSPENSLSGDIENTEQIMNVSQSDFLALQSLEIYTKWTHKFNIKFTHEKETLYVQGALSDFSEEMKKEIEKEISALRGKQKVEITYELQEKEQFRSAVDEAKSDQLLLVWDDDNKQVLVYGDSYDEMQKFKHKVEFKMGKKKITGRRGKRFANEENTVSLLSEWETPIQKNITHSFSWSQDATNVEIFRTLEGIMVKVYEANILKLGVDCIVNAANDNLQHGGGVALVIAKAAGPEIDREGSEILKIRGRIKVGEQCVTTAGNLPYDCIIHTVGPRWSDYYPHDARNTARCEKDLFNSVIGCFFEAENRNLKSIALPAISSGIFAVPRDMCTEQYVKAVIHYSKTRTSQVLQEIHFIDKLPDIVKDMQLAFKRYLSGDGNARHIVKGDDQTTAINDHAGRDNGCSEYDNIPKTSFETFREDDGQTKRKQNPASPVCPEIEQKIIKKQKFCVYKPNKNLEVNIHTTDITKMIGVEAIVCSDDRRGTGPGAVASALLKMGKSKYENAKKKAFEKEACFGDVIGTVGGDSNFQLVIHAVVPSFKDKMLVQEHKEIVKKCYDRILDDINNWQKASLVLPLIGTGCVELGYEGSAKLFLDSLEVFCNRTMILNIKVIHIVDKDELLTQKIADVFIKHTETVRKHLLATHGSMLKPLQYPSSNNSSVRLQGEISQVKPKSPVSGALSKKDCSVCLKEVKSPKTLNCGHTFCLKCIEIKFEIKPVCPKCGAFHGKIYGDQPDGGQMTVSILKFSLKGFDKSDTIKIEYSIPGGKQGPNHPEPGKWFHSMKKIAYLPDTTEGKKVCELLNVAFKRGLIFKLSRSKWGVDGGLVWSDIHHKTEFSGGQYGYPDYGYLKRVQEQLAAKGVTEADLKHETAL